MAEPEHLAILKQGVEKWNAWRRTELLDPDLTGGSLQHEQLEGIDLSFTNLTGADLSGANLRDANLTGANLSNAHLHLTYFANANLSEAKLHSAHLCLATLKEANLRSADLDGADLSRCLVGDTIFGDMDLSRAKGLEELAHEGPSVLGIDTIIKSKGRIPEVFLRGVGVPDAFIAYAQGLTSNPIRFSSCFISYSTKDQTFADRLYADLQATGVRCWFAPHDIQGGRKIHEQIDEAIRKYQKLLLILSPSSMNSNWVSTEVASARNREQREGVRMLFPVSVVSFEAIRSWKQFDADIGIDSAREVREYFIPDFSQWGTDQTAYDIAFAKLLAGLRNE